MRILVTDAHELAGLGAVRSLGRAGHDVIAAYPAGLQRPASTYSRYCRECRVHPDPWRSQPDFRRWLVANAAAVDLVLPITEAAIVAAASCRSQLACGARLVVPAAESLDYTLSKRRATAKALALGILCPGTAFSLEEVANLTGPYLVRTDNRLMSDGSYCKGRNWYIDDRAQVRDLLDELTENREQWIVQEHIVGKGVGGFLLTWRGQTLLEFAHERVHEVPFHGGMSSLRKSVHDPALTTTTAKLLTSIGYDGAAMVEFRRSHPDQVPYFVEINGRLWGSLALALHAGADFPARLVECYAGPLPLHASADYASGILCRNVYPGELDYLRSVLAARGPVHGIYPPGRMKTLLEFFTLFFRPRIHYDYLWVRDPLPWIWHSIRACGRVSQSRWSKWRRNIRQRRLLKEFQRRHLVAAPDLREVLFLCYGNICRSAFAGAYWNQSRGGRPAAQSAGFYPDGNRRTPLRIRQISQELGVDLVGHRSRLVDSATVERATAIFVMDGENIEDLLSRFPVSRAKTWLLGSFGGFRAIRDPYLLPQTEATESLRQVKESIDLILQRFVSHVG
jgi:protein-tyrosine-phosphatase/predicted ATP-grasp superfamily ATP-dependent carboligase